jgi:hypothetical protein
VAPIGQKPLARPTRLNTPATAARADSPGFLDAALRTDPRPLSFELNLPYFAGQHLTFRRGTIAMYNKNWRPAASTSTDPAISRKIDDSTSKSGGKKTRGAGCDP